MHRVNSLVQIEGKHYADLRGDQGVNGTET